MTTKEFLEAKEAELIRSVNDGNDEAEEELAFVQVCLMRLAALKELQERRKADAATAKPLNFTPPSEEWLRAAAEKEDGCCVSVGGWVVAVERAEKAANEADAMPVSQERMAEIVDFAMDPANTPTNADTAQMAVDNKRLREELAAAKSAHHTHRWNIEEVSNGIGVCRGNHDKAAPCEWEVFVPVERVAKLERELAAAKELNDRWPSKWLAELSKLTKRAEAAERELVEAKAARVEANRQYVELSNETAGHIERAEAAEAEVARFKREIIACGPVREDGTKAEFDWNILGRLDRLETAETRVKELESLASYEMACEYRSKHRIAKSKLATALTALERIDREVLMDPCEYIRGIARDAIAAIQ